MSRVKPTELVEELFSDKKALETGEIKQRIRKITGLMTPVIIDRHLRRLSEEGLIKNEGVFWVRA